MDKKIEKDLKNKLEKERKRLIRELKFFARKDKKIKGNWLTKFPFLGIDRSHKDEAAEEIEQYDNLLPIEHALEERLRDIDEALEKMKRGRYGWCDNCKKEIKIERLKAVPEAKLCLKCGKK